MDDEKDNFDSRDRGRRVLPRHDRRAAGGRVLLLRGTFWLAAGLAGAACFALLHAPVRADDFGILLDNSTVVGGFDNGEANATQQHQTSIRNLTFAATPYICSVKLPGLGTVGTPTDELRVSLYSKATAWVNGDLASGGTLITSTTLTAAAIIGGAQTFTFPNCQGTTATFNYGVLIQRTGAESDTNHYSVGYNNGAGTDLAIFSAGAWGDATPSPKRGSIIVYGFDVVSGYSILLDAPADGSTVNTPSGFLIRATAPTSTLARVIYNDAYGGSWTATSTVYSPQVYQQINLYASPATFHNGSWTAQAYLLNASSGVIALSGWKSFTVVPYNYAAAVASSNAAIAGGIFTEEACGVDASFWTASSSVFSCVISNSIKAGLNILAQNIKAAFDGVASMGIFPLNVFKHLSDDLLLASPTTSSTAITWRFMNKDYDLISSSTVAAGASRLGISNFRQTLNYFMYLITGLVMLIIAIGVISDFNQQK